MNKYGPDKRRSVCNICNKVIIGSSYKFKSHLYQHNAVKPRFKCGYCSKEFFRSDLFSKHLGGHTGTTQKKTYICDHCDRSFAVKRNLILHLKIHDDLHTFKYQCIACRVSYCEERLLKYHIRKTHYNWNKNQIKNTTQKENETWVERVKESETYLQVTKNNNNVTVKDDVTTKKSDVTAKKSDVTTKKYNVTATKSDVKTEECKIRNETEQFNEYVSSVFAQNDNTQYSRAKCDYCNKEMLKKSLLSHIRERHLKIRKFHCDICQRGFMRHYQLVDHVCGKTRVNRNGKRNSKLIRKENS